MSLLSEPSHFKITVNSVDFTAPTGSIDLDIEVMEEGADISQMVLRMSLNEEGVSYGGDTYYDVTRAMLTAVPITVSTLGQVQNVTTTFDVNAAWVTANLKVTAFLQDDVTKKVHASASTLPIPDYCLRFLSLGERQIVGPSSGITEYEPFRVYNFGDYTDTYTVDLTGDIPAGWVTGICDDQVCYGPTYSQSLAPGEYMELHLMVDPSSPGYASMSVVMSQTNLAHQFPRQLDYGYFTNDLDVLLVDDDGADAYEAYYTDALTYGGYTYGIWDRLAGAVSADILNQFPIVVWNVGFAFPTVEANDRAALSTYLDAGGALFISGQDVGWDLNDQGGAAYQWYQDYLHAIFVNDDTNDYTLSGVVGDPVSDGIDLVIQGGDGANNQDYPSDIDPRDASATIIWTYDAYRNAALRADTDTYRVIYFAFGYEAINNADDRRAVMMRCIEWLGGGTTAVQGSGPRLHAFLRSAPNPAKFSSALEFSLPIAGTTNLKVYGTDGRLVRTLLNGPTDAGTHVINWDLTDLRGNRLPAGVYFYRLQGQEVEMTRKILLLK